MNSLNLKDTKLKISITQDGLLPEETTEILNFRFPALQKKLLAALGFERVDANTFVGVVPVFINLGSKNQEVELELGVSIPELRKQVVEILKAPSRLAEEKSSGDDGEQTNNVIKLNKKEKRSANPPKSRKK